MSKSADILIETNNGAKASYNTRSLKRLWTKVCFGLGKNTLN
ncbi:hypothetical protein F0Z19_3826 [Vibrio cyclitrophicus]|nr:hypothetical protein F0Z19_3826 [Vibrio cyclitrophicus]